MNLYAVINFVHILASVGMIVAFVIERLMMQKLISASSDEQFRQWKTLHTLPIRFGAPSIILTLITGIYLSVVAWPQAPWVWVAIAGLALIAITGATLTGTSQNVFKNAKSAREIGPTWGKLWFSIQIRIGLMIGILFLMVAKPNLEQSILALVLFTTVVTLPVGYFWRRYKPLRS
jgi:hypothetical protein